VGEMRRTVVHGGTLATEYGVFAAHLVVEGGRITALSDDDGVLANADEVIDARGLVVLPGAIDPHAHFEDPGHTEREDFATGTMAAAAGGFTTVFEHPLTYPPVTTVDLYTAKRDMAAEKVVIDFGLWGALTAPSLPHIEGQWREGAAGFKAFMPRSDPSYPNVSDDEMLEGMRTVAGLGGLVLIHAENDALLHGNIGRLRAAGRTDMRAHHESRPPFVEEEAVHRALFLARHAGVRVQIVHTSTPVSVGLVAAARDAGVVASAEVCPHHLILDLDDADRLGPLGCCAPPVRARAVVEGMWERVLAGDVDCLVSDHSAYTLEEKALGERDIFACPLGCQVIQETVPVVLSEAVHRRGMALDAFARFSATNAARILGLHPRKGTIRPGADADLAIWDLDAEWTVDPQAQQFSKNPWSPFAGRTVRGRVVRTLVRGETVFRDGEICVAPGHGRFLSSQDVRVPAPAAGPA
jgi:allantoinase